MLSLALLSSELALPEIAERCRRNAVRQAESGFGKDFDRNFFATLAVEALVRAKRFRDAAAATQRFQLDTPDFARESKGVSIALLAAAYYGLGDTLTAGACLDAFKRGDNGRPRDILPETRRAVASLLRLAGAGAAALHLLEDDARALRENPQSLADYISVRIATGRVIREGRRQSLAENIEALLKMPRPNPRVWTEISDWLKTPAAATDPRNAALAPKITPLLRPALTGFGFL